MFGLMTHRLMALRALSEFTLCVSRKGVVKHAGKVLVDVTYADGDVNERLPQSSSRLSPRVVVDKVHDFHVSPPVRSDEGI